LLVEAREWMNLVAGRRVPMVHCPVRGQLPTAEARQALHRELTASIWNT
jgi:hypothetical protein